VLRNVFVNLFVVFLLVLINAIQQVHEVVVVLCVLDFEFNDFVNLPEVQILACDSTHLVNDEAGEQDEDS